MPRMARVIVTIFGRPPPPEPLPVPPPAVTVTARPPYQACPACGVSWRGDDPCWSCGQSHPSQQEEP